MSMDPKFVELTADVVKIIYYIYTQRHRPRLSQRRRLTAQLLLYRECQKHRPSTAMCDAKPEQQSKKKKGKYGFLWAFAAAVVCSAHLV